MRFSLRLLKKYLATEVPAEQLLEAITDVGLEVEEVIDLGMLSGKLLVGEIMQIDAIEGADKIRMTHINVGAAERMKIVCGAMNIEVGHKVPVALFGMTFPNGEVLKPRKIRGLESQGMLCSAKELGVAEDADGIWLLPEDTPVGEPFDALVTIKITPNRPDALSLVGIARDLAARTGGELLYPDTTVPESANRAESRAKVTLEAKVDCPRYTARVIEDVKIGPSPRWLQHVLEAAGKRPINNIVDITNFVMLELGHPLHAFDMDLLADQHVVVRLAREGETLETLDGETAKLKPTDLLICDVKRGVALAGVMGGANSEIAAGTTNVFLESAYFRPSTIRKTARHLDKNTDASYRFERGMDPRRLTAALNRAAQLMAKYAGGTVLKGIIDAVGAIPEPAKITLRISRVKEMLSYELTGREIADVLTTLGFEILRSDPDELLVEAPTNRPDVSIEEDLIEEIARIAGYDRIPDLLPLLPAQWKEAAPAAVLRDRSRETLVELGFCEALNFSFTSEGANALAGLADGRQVRVKNPLTADQAVMRRSLVPSLLQNLVHNVDHGVGDVRLFEIGSTYAWRDETPDAPRDQRDLTTPAVEIPMACALLSGGGKANWRDGARDYDFFDIKGIAEALLASLGVTRTVIERLENVPFLHPGRAAGILVKGEPILRFGEVHPAVAKELGLKKRAFVLELTLHQVLLESAKAPSYTELPKFPISQRDLALVVDRGTSAQDLERTIRKAGKELLAGVALFDVYEGAQLGEGKKSLAYSLTFRAADRTLQDNEVTSAIDAIVKLLGEKHAASVR